MNEEATDCFPLKSVEMMDGSLWSLIRERLHEYCITVARCVEVELLDISALDFFLQTNYIRVTLTANAAASVTVTVTVTETVTVAGKFSYN